jgi:putative oxidoreductase
MIDTVSLGLLVLRLVIGLTLAAHGAQKLFGWFSGPGVTRWMQGMQRQGFKPPALWTALVILGELGGGLSLAAGLLTPLGAAGISGAMLMAIATSHWPNGFFNSKRGIEFPLSLLASAVAIGIAGPGRYALDPLFHIHLPEAPLFGALAGAAVLVDIAGLLIRRGASPTPAQAPTQGV